MMLPWILVRRQQHRLSLLSLFLDQSSY
jgi:hypothetical protein